MQCLQLNPCCWSHGAARIMATMQTQRGVPLGAAPALGRDCHSSGRNLRLRSRFAPFQSQQRAGRWRTCAPVASAASPLAAADLPNPFAHERSDTNPEDSLRAALWHVLQNADGGLEPSEIVSRLGQLGRGWKLAEGGADEQKVRQQLQDSIYFVPDDTRFDNGKPVGSSSKWTLAVLRPVRWGIVGTGGIAEDVVSMMALLPGTDVVAVGARKDVEDAKTFADKHGGRNLYGSFEEVGGDSEVDAAYVNAIHVTHKDLSIAMLEGGKHVLSEKPIAIHANLARDMISKAKEKDLFLTEGLWSRFFPATQKVRQLIEAGTIGKVKLVQGQICIDMRDVKRLYDTDMGGGGLLDIGLYMIGIASWAFGGERPDAADAFGVLADSGADVAGTISLRYGESGLANLHYSIEYDAPIEATVFGTKGRIKIHHRAHNPEAITLVTMDDEGKEIEQRMEFPNPAKPDGIDHGDADGGFNFPGSAGFIWQAMAVHSALLKGRREMDDISHDETVMMMELTDMLRESEHLTVEYKQDACKKRD